MIDGPRSRWLPHRNEVEADDPRAYDSANYIGAGLLAIPILALAIAAMFLPPGIAIALIRRGVGEGRLTWVLLGSGLALAWLWGMRRTIKKMMTAQPPADVRDDDTPKNGVR